MKVNYSFTGKMQTFVAPIKGYYRLSAWGASGQCERCGNVNGFSGSFASGVVQLQKGDTIYIFVGEHIPQYAYVGTYTRMAAFNGGGSGGEGYWSNLKLGTSGGGATDFRFFPGEWNNYTSLLSRFIVAAGGGGQDQYCGGHGTKKGQYGYGGTIIGGDGSWGRYDDTYAGNVQGFGALQTMGGMDNDRVIRSGFGFGADGMKPKIDAKQIPGSGGGGGYYGGGGGMHGTHASSGGGGGGSSFIYGAPNCTAHPDNNIPKALIISNYHMISGKDEMLDGEGRVQTGNRGNGFAQITLIEAFSNLNKSAWSFLLTSSVLFLCLPK